MSQRILAAAVVACLALAPLAVMVASPVDAVAQARAPAAKVRDVKDAKKTPDKLEPGEGFGNGTAAAVFFWLFAVASVAGSLFVITRRNMVTAVMGMVGTFFALAALYAMLYAHFLAAIQVLVYAGAIMVLFVFVIMILNRPEEEPWAIQGLAGKGIAGLSLVYLLYRLATVLWTVKDLPHANAQPIIPGGFEFGSTKSVGKVLFTDYLFPFEAISIVLLVAVVGAIAIARPAQSIAAEGAAEAAEPEGEGS